MKDSKSGSAGTQTVDTIGSGTNLTTLPQRRVSPDTFESQDYRQALELKPVGNLLKNDTTPDVANNEHWIAQNVAAVSVTDFDNGQDGHHIYILGDGFTTVVHSANIINVAGVDILLDSGVIYHYVNVYGVWYQICCTEGGGGGGSVAWVDITGKPSVFPPDYVGFPPDWGDITGIPATFPPDYGTYPPDWSFITGKPATFPPDMSGVDLDDLADVNTVGVAASMFLRYDGAQWIAESVAIPSGDLAGLSDVVLTAPADGDVLTYDSGTSKWINQAPSGGGGDAYLANTQTFTGINTYTQYASFDAGIVTHLGTANRIDFGIGSGAHGGLYGAATGEVIYNADTHRFRDKSGGTEWAIVTGAVITVYGGFRSESGYPYVQYRDTGLAVNAGGLWMCGAANGVYQFVKNTAAAGDFSTYDSGYIDVNSSVYGSIIVGSAYNGYAGIRFASAYNAMTMMLSTSLAGPNGFYEPTSARWVMYVSESGPAGDATLFLGNAATAALYKNGDYLLVQAASATTPTRIYLGSNGDPQIYIDADNCNFRTQSATNNFRIQRTGTTCNIYHQATTGNCGTTGDPWDAVHVILNGGYYVNSIKVVGNRVTGWNAPTGAVVRGTFAVAGATAATCAGAIAAIITDLRAHGLLGT